MTGKDWGSVHYVNEQFRKYYAINAGQVIGPPYLIQREFGFLSFESRSMFRHIAFREVNELNRYLKENGPAHSYFSAAYYKSPQASMENKGWLGADLVFDIDADHFDLACQKEHDTWNCTTCDREGVGHPPEVCPDCGRASFSEESWLCPKCLHAAKHEAQKLLDILIQDLGFKASDEILINFSGNRGYHVHVRSTTIKNMDQLARREIVDYVLGIGLKAEYHGFKSSQLGDDTNLIAKGWRGRSMRSLYDFILKAPNERMKSLKLGGSTAKNIIENRDEILELLTKSHSKIIAKYIDLKSLDKIFEVAVREQASAIDTVVTTDLRRLIRIPQTLHGKTGWISQRIPYDELGEYDPLESAIAFTTGTEKVFIKKTPEITIAGETYGPFENQAVELPMAVVMFLLCRKAAKVA